MTLDDEWLDDEEEEESGESDGADPAAHTVLTFTVGGTLFGLRIAQVTEIVAVPEVTALPQAPPWLPGVAMLRGRIVPLVDLRLRLGLDTSARGARPCAVVTEGGAFPVGLVLDEVRDVVSIPAERLTPPPVRSGSGFVSALGRVGDGVAILLDPGRLLESSEQQMVSAAVLAAKEAAQALEPEAAPAVRPRAAALVPPEPPGASAQRPTCTGAPPAALPTAAKTQPSTLHRHERPGSGPHAG